MSLQTMEQVNRSPTLTPAQGKKSNKPLVKPEVLKVICSYQTI